LPLWSPTHWHLSFQCTNALFTSSLGTGCRTQTVASRDRRMSRSHTVGMGKYKAKYSFSLRQISLIFIVRFCALNFSVLRSTHRGCTLRAKMDLRSIVTYLSMKDMNAREIYALLEQTVLAAQLSRNISEKKVSRSRRLTRISSRKVKRISSMKQFLGLLRNAPFLRSARLPQEDSFQ
jgi:hypothetical protein